jgi:hypothetical protein
MEHVPFGAFNPRFYGVSIFLGGEDRVDFVDRYGRANDPAEWVRDVHMPELSEVSTLSAIDHEVRHFHDFLLSPLGTIVMGLRMQASINGIQAMQALARCRGKFVPVPIIRWIQWDDAARQRWIDSTGSFFRIGKSSDIVALPHSPDVTGSNFQVGAQSVPDAIPPEEQLSGYALLAAQAYSSMSMWRQRRVSRFEMDVSADDVFEAAAHLVQLQAVWIGQGQQAGERFLDFVLTSSAKHLEPLQVLWAALQRSSPTIGVKRATELFTWMLLGPWEQLASDGHPANRYFQVLELCAGAPNDDTLVGSMSTGQLFDRLDGSIGNPSWADNLRSAAASADRRIGRYASLATTLKGDYFDALFGVATAWHHDQNCVRQTFLADPESLAHPHRYLSESRFPLPFVETRFGWMVHERDNRIDLTNHRAITVDAEGKKVLSYINKLGSSQSTEGLDNALSARLLTHMVDFLFADEPVLDVYEHWCRSQAQALVGKELVSVY